RRLTFKTHVINVLGAGAILERSARMARSDRELSAAALMTQRSDERHRYANAMELRRKQYEGRRLSPEVEAMLQFQDLPWSTRMRQMVERWRLGANGVERFNREHPNEAADLNIGMRVRRGGPAVAFLSVAFFLFYWLCLIGGEELAHRLIIPAWLAMWLPNLVLGGLGLYWTLQ